MTLPRDHGVHPGFAVEWWYGAGRVRDGAGRGYAWFATVWTAGPGAVGRVNVVDLRDDRVVLSREYVKLGPQSPVAPLSLDVNGLRIRWRPDGTLGRFEVEAPTDDGSLTLRLVPRRRYVLHGRRGIIEQGGGGPSGYYSSTRLAARGALRLGTRRRTPSAARAGSTTSGATTPSNPESLRWDWFACRFADGRDLMLYRFLDTDNRPRPQYFTGTLVDRRGRQRTGSRASGRRRAARSCTPRGPRPPTRWAGACACRGPGSTSRSRRWHGTSSSRTSWSRASGKGRRG